MFRIATLVFAIAGTTLAGILVMVVLATPSLADQAMRLVPIAAGGGFALGVPISYFVARAMLDRGMGRA